VDAVIKLDFPAPGLAAVAVPPEASVRDALLQAQDIGPRLAGRQVQIFCDDPAVSAALAWALKPWLRAGTWAVNGKLISL
jgi:hypothetical protein